MSDEELLTLQEAADELGVHYMTAYRRVRLGKLPAHKAGGEWRVRRSDLTPGEPPRPGRRSTDYPAELVRTMVNADEAATWVVVEDALSSGMEPLTFHIDVLTPALREIGDMWERGDISVAQEHQASAVALRVIGRLGPRFTRRGRTKGTIILGAPPDDLHGLPTAIMADVLRADGYSVIDLGARVPAKSFAMVAAAVDRLVAVGIAATSSDTVSGLTDTIAELRKVVDVPIILGGAAITDDAEARELGADAYGADAQSGVEVIGSSISSWGE